MKSSRYCRKIIDIIYSIFERYELPFFLKINKSSCVSFLLNSSLEISLKINYFEKILLYSGQRRRNSPSVGLSWGFQQSPAQVSAKSVSIFKILIKNIFKFSGWIKWIVGKGYFFSLSGDKFVDSVIDRFDGPRGTRVAKGYRQPPGWQLSKLTEG